MEQYDLWKIFAQTGRVEDYLRYRGIVNVRDAGEGADGGKPGETTRYDGRIDPAGVRHRR